MCPAKRTTQQLPQGDAPPPDRILVVEDEPAIAESLQYALSRQGFEARTAGSLEAAMEARLWANLIVLDLMLPDGNGHTLIERLRRERVTTPVIVLSSRDGESDRVSALDAGADDYVTKPFSTLEVVARVRAVLRRQSPSASAQAPAPALGLSLDRSRRTARFAGQELVLTRVEFDLLCELCAGRGRVYSRGQLIDRVWGNGYAITDRTVDSHVKSLRRKLADAGDSHGMLETVRGVGYRISTLTEAVTPAAESI